MYYIYIIRSQTGRFYIWSTQNIEKRVAQHNEKHFKKWTNREDDWKLVYSEEYPDITSARMREKQIKSYKWWTAFKWPIKPQGS